MGDRLRNDQRRNDRPEPERDRAGALARELGEILLGLAQLSLDDLRASKERPSELGRHHTARGTQHQWNTQLGLERPDTLRYPWLRDTERARCRAKAARLDHGEKIPDLV